jgi:hypothetical protein
LIDIVIELSCIQPFQPRSNTCCIRPLLKLEPKYYRETDSNNELVQHHFVRQFLRL